MVMVRHSRSLVVPSGPYVTTKLDMNVNTPWYATDQQGRRSWELDSKAFHLLSLAQPGQPCFACGPLVGSLF